MPKGGAGQRRPWSGRALRQRVRTAAKRTPSSTRWLERQLNDPYVRRSREEGYRSRAAYKLIEIDDRHRLLVPGGVVVDLGAAPGGWSQVAAERVGSSDEDARIVAIDYLDMDPIPGVVFLKKNFLEADAPEAIAGALKGRPVDVVLSDMAAPTTGHRRTDHLRTTHLFEVAAEFAFAVLKPGGAFLAKVFQGGTEAASLVELKKRFRTVSHVKPPASRSESPELYVLATGFRAAGTESSGNTGQ